MILMNDFNADPPELREAMLDAAQRVLESGWYVLGNEVKAFEQQWAEACGVSYGIGVGNGMDAIEIALRSLDIGIGDEVITTPMTAFATVLAIIRSGATPVLADTEPNTALLALESVRRCVTIRTKAVLLVHLYGQVRDMDQWVSFSRNQGISLIEDCAQAHMASWQGVMAGCFGIVGTYSFYPTKNLGAVGDGGMVVTSEAGLAERAMQLRNYGQSVRYHHPVIGMNSRLDEIHAAMLTERLKWLPDFTERRRQIAEAYHHGIDNPLISKLAFPQERGAHVYHLYVITSPQRDALALYLKERGVQTLIHYPVPVHQQEPCRDLSCDPTGLVNSESHARECLSIPCHPQMTQIEVEQVIDAINEFGGV